MPASHTSSIQASPRNMRLVTSQDLLYTSINATLSTKTNRPSTPVHHIQEDDYTVPAPPPPSPVSFRPGDCARLDSLMRPLQLCSPLHVTDDSHAGVRHWTH